MTPIPKRRLFSFTLRTLFVVVTVLAWGLACQPYVVTKFGPPDESVILAGMVASTVVPYRCPNPKLAWPAMTFVAFIGWKTFWRIRQRRKPARALKTRPDQLTVQPLQE